MPDDAFKPFFYIDLHMLHNWNQESRISSLHVNYYRHSLALVWLLPEIMTYCERCDRSFGSWSALYRHKADSSRHNICDDCSKDFPTWTGLKEHWVQSPRHPYCQRCDDHFDDFSELEDHYNDSHHYCPPCKRFFVNDYGLQEHYRQSHHYCSSCKRIFRSESNLKSVYQYHHKFICIVFTDQPFLQHLNSSHHRPKDVVCPFRGCDKKFVSRSALVLHLEGGACQSGIDRATINRYVRQYDTNNIITDASRLLTNGTASDNTKYFASERSWNGYRYECYLCHSSYSTLASLNQHLASPIHQDKIYICPGSTCRARFTTLSALCQHIESEKCGVSKFRAVQHTMDRLLGQMGRLTL